jgi:hypothetical protein
MAPRAGVTFLRRRCRQAALIGTKASPLPSFSMVPAPGAKKLRTGFSAPTLFPRDTMTMEEIACLAEKPRG